MKWLVILPRSSANVYVIADKYEQVNNSFNFYNKTDLVASFPVVDVSGIIKDGHVEIVTFNGEKPQ